MPLPLILLLPCPVLLTACGPVAIDATAPVSATTSGTALIERPPGQAQVGSGRAF